uniref:CW-type domain-containing protein n=1 Tax=Chromera velia CCMP2878 TaxID=1169474 RepID=A0A0G4G9P0_9ALVE|eukprot:Cvel_4364.t1-p1 / transcript=Cvel_4364.t1 / gene=Cvel_4364 / organism=Chromera_velia_CCMP2878 / gene_product=MORC family CW-type zinc finger protein 3, putative / transcript_product=MORC family CW-type zinc finger protein 3, putative / location=Cvel_scaffold189:39238-42622(+) / protein_length=864 / sequence_SO=supercontig / SO=protein_coding / is_pseudo=false
MPAWYWSQSADSTGTVGKRWKVLDVKTGQTLYQQVVGGGWETFVPHQDHLRLAEEGNKTEEERRRREEERRRREEERRRREEDEADFERRRERKLLPRQSEITSHSESTSGFASPRRTNTSRGVSPGRTTSINQTASPGMLVRVQKNYLEGMQQRHGAWLFGGVAEMVHNSSDADATQLYIDVFFDSHHQENVLEVRDNGTGMSPETVKDRLFSFGRDEAETQRDQSKAGRWGVGYKMGSMRVADTAVVVTKQKKSDTVSVGIMCNRPFREEGRLFVFENTTLTYPDFRVHPRYSSQEKYDKVASELAQWSFLNREKIAWVVATRWRDNESGTAVFLQHWREGFERLEVVRPCSNEGGEGGDLRLVDSTRKGRMFQQEMRENSNDPVRIDFSLREYLRWMFFEPKMQIFVLGAPVQTDRITETLERCESVTLMKHNGRPLTALLGYSKEFEERKTGGAMLYGANCLIKAFERKSLDLNENQGWGLVAAVHVPLGKGFELQQHKQAFVPTPPFVKIMAALRGKVLARLYRENHPAPVTLESRESDLSVFGWAQCENRKCRGNDGGKWRKVPQSLHARLEDPVSSEHFFCYHEECPVMVRLRGDPKNRHLTPSQLAEKACDEPEDEMEEDEVTTAARVDGQDTRAGRGAGEDLTDDEGGESDDEPGVLYHVLEPADMLKFDRDGKLQAIERLPKMRNTSEAEEAYGKLWHHVQNGDKKHFRSKFISCTKKMKWALWYFQRRSQAEERWEGPIFEIDVEKWKKEMEPRGKRLIDISKPSGVKQNGGSLGSQISSWSISASEVVLPSRIPVEAIRAVYNPLKKVLRKDGGEAISSRHRLHNVVGYAQNGFLKWSDHFERAFSTDKDVR